jgi:hypothetical protein
VVSRLAVAELEAFRARRDAVVVLARTREHGLGPRVAGDRLRVSHALADLPMLEAELEEGTFQYSHVKELTRVVTPETEDEWIAAAKGKTCGDVQVMVSGHKKGDGPDDPTDPDLRLRRFSIELPPQTIASYRELWAAIEAELGRRIEEAEFFRIMIERARVSPEGASTPAQISIAGATVEEAVALMGSDATIDVLIREALRRCPRPLG